MTSFHWQEMVKMQSGQNLNNNNLQYLHSN